MTKKRLIVAITGASGAIYGIRLLQVLKGSGTRIETHGIITAAGLANLKIENSMTTEDFVRLCTRTYDEGDIGASIASGSFLTSGMAIVPCSMGTLARVSHGISDNLITRAADVCLKEGRKLVLVPRETPLDVVHIRNMMIAAEAGAVILPAMPGFYHRPKGIEDLVDHIVGKVLDCYGIEHSLFRRWSGDRARSSARD